MERKIDSTWPDGEGKKEPSLLLDDPLFFELARFHVATNYYGMVFQWGNLREMREDTRAVPLLLFVDIDGLDDIVEKKPWEFRHVTLDTLSDIVIREANPDGFYDERGIYQDPSDGGYYVKRTGDGLLLSRGKHIVAHQDRVVARYNEQNPADPLTGDDAFEKIVTLCLPDDFSRFAGTKRAAGGRTQGALAAALSGTDKTNTYILKQTVYDGVMGKLCRFGQNGLEAEFFLNALPHAALAQEDSFHPDAPIIGVLRVYLDGDPTRREEYRITPRDLGIDVRSYTT